jgi:hypothetical protein
LAVVVRYRTYNSKGADMLSTLLWIILVVIIVGLILNFVGPGTWTTNNGVTGGGVIAIVLILILLLVVL